MIDINVNGSSVSYTASSFYIEDTINGRSVAGFEIIDQTGSVSYAKGMPVVITNTVDDVVVFKGFIDSADLTVKGGFYLYKMSCTDMHYLADKRVCAKAYANEWSGDVIDDLIGSYMGEEGVLGRRVPVTVTRDSNATEDWFSYNFDYLDWGGKAAWSLQAVQKYPLFEDTFDVDNLASDYTVEVDNGASWSVASGKLTITNSSTTTHNIRSINSAGTLSDLSVVATIEQAGCCSLSFTFNGVGNRFEFLILDDTGVAEMGFNHNILGYTVKGGVSTNVMASDVTWPRGTPAVIGVHKFGHIIELAFNHIIIWRAPFLQGFTELYKESGKVAIGNYNGTSVWSSLAVYNGRDSPRFTTMANQGGGYGLVVEQQATNLLTVSQSSAEYWSLTGISGMNATPSIAVGHSYNGHLSFKFTSTANSQYAGGTAGGWVSVTPNSYYISSVFVSRDAAAARPERVYLTMWWFDSGNGVISNIGQLVTLPSDGSLIRVYVCGQAPSNAAYLQIEAYADGTYLIGDSFYMDGLMIETGSATVTTPSTWVEGSTTRMEDVVTLPKNGLWPGRRGTIEFVFKPLRVGSSSSSGILGMGKINLGYDLFSIGWGSGWGLNAIHCGMRDKTQSVTNYAYVDLGQSAVIGQEYYVAFRWDLDANIATCKVYDYQRSLLFTGNSTSMVAEPTFEGYNNIYIGRRCEDATGGGAAFKNLRFSHTYRTDAEIVTAYTNGITFDSNTIALYTFNHEVDPVSTIDKGVLLKEAVFNYVKCSKALTSVTERNAGYWWCIAPSRLLYFTDDEGVPSDKATVGYADVIGTSLKVNNKNNAYRNTQYVQGGVEVTTPQVETFAPDGAQKSYTLGYNVNDVMDVSVKRPCIYYDDITEKAYSPSFNINTSFTAVAKLFSANVAASPNNARILEFGSPAAFIIKKWEATTGISAYVANVNTTAAGYMRSDSTVQTVVFVVNTSTQVATLYLDGVVIGTCAAPSSVNYTNPLYVGSSQASSIPWFGGLVEVGIFPRAFTADEVATVTKNSCAFTNVAGPASLIYLFNEGSGTSLTDYSGNGRTGTISGPSWVSTADGPSIRQSYGDKSSSGKTFYWSKGESAIAQDTSSPTLKTHERLSVTYRGEFPMVTMSQDYAQIAERKSVEGIGTGRVDNVVYDSSFNSSDTAMAFAAELLAVYGFVGTVAVFNTYVTNLYPGEYTTVTLDAHGITSLQMLVHKSVTKLEGGRVLRTLSLSDNTVTDDWVKLYKGLTDNGVIRENIGSNDVLITTMPTSESWGWAEAVTQNAVTVYKCSTTLYPNTNVYPG